MSSTDAFGFASAPINSCPMSSPTFTITAIIKASSTNSVAMVDFIDQPTTKRKYRSITTVKYTQPS